MSRISNLDHESEVDCHGGPDQYCCKKREVGQAVEALGNRQCHPSLSEGLGKIEVLPFNLSSFHDLAYKLYTKLVDCSATGLFTESMRQVGDQNSSSAMKGLRILPHRNKLGNVFSCHPQNRRTAIPPLRSPHYHACIVAQKSSADGFPCLCRL